MSKHHHQSKEDQINTKVHDKEQLYQDKMSYHKNGEMNSEAMGRKVAVDSNSIQFRAYQIYREKGGSELAGGRKKFKGE